MAIYSGFTREEKKVVFHSYVSLPEGIHTSGQIIIIH